MVGLQQYHISPSRACAHPAHAHNSWQPGHHLEQLEANLEAESESA